MDLQIKKSISKSCSLHGFSIKADAMKYLINFLNSNSDSQNPLLVIEEILKNIDKTNLKGNIIDQTTIEKSIKDIKITKNSDLIEQEVFKVVNSFDIPLYTYDQNQNLFIKNENFNKSLHSDAKSKSELYRKRYLNVLQRIQRHAFFSTPVLPSEKLKREFNSITPLSSLLGNAGRKYVLGTISQITEGTYYLEDLNTNVPLDLSGAEFEYGLVTENSIVQVKGEFRDGVFHAERIELPPTEERQESLKELQGVDMFAGDDSLYKSKAIREQFERYEREQESNSLIFLSDVHLDNLQVIENLDRLFEGYNDCAPFAFILMGNFTEHPLLDGTQYKLKTYFDRLATIIIKHQNIHRESRFVFIPGPTDPTGLHLNILPKFPIPKVFTKDFQFKIPNSDFTTNPCRLRYCTQDIVIFRDDLINRMKRHSILEPSDNYEISQHMVGLICSNSHLCNLPLDIRPVYWNFDHALSLYPLPDVLVLGDKADQYHHNMYDGTNCFNPSSFSTDFSFSHYIPSTKSCHFSKIDNNSNNGDNSDKESISSNNHDDNNNDDDDDVNMNESN